MNYYERFLDRLAFYERQSAPSIPDMEQDWENMTPKIIPMDMSIPDTLLNMVQDIETQGYRAYIVGGSVRDALMGYEPKDLDVEVYGCDYESLIDILSKYGKPNTVGKNFGVIKLVDSEGNDYDFSLPRRDSKVTDNTDTSGRGFEVKVDPNISPAEAGARRDFSMNALVYDPLKGEIYDYFNGVEDINNGILRATSPAFAEDPLRVLRGMQFAARFDMVVEEETAQMAESLKDSPLVKERLSEEWLKLFTKGAHPSKGLEYLVDTGWIDNYPELRDLIGVQQNEKHHPEGDAFKHTCLVMDASAALSDDMGLPPEDRAVLVMTAMTHDLGKAQTTVQKELDGEMVWTSPGHADKSVELSQNLLKSIGIKKDMISKVTPLVAYHMDHYNYDGKNIPKTVRNLSNKLFPATIEQLSYIMQADKMGKDTTEALDDITQEYLDYAKEHDLYSKKVSPIIQGKDIIEVFPNVPRDQNLGTVLGKVNQEYFDNIINTKEEAVDKALKLLKKIHCVVTGKDIIDYFNIPQGPSVGEYIDIIWDKQVSGEVASKEEGLAYIDSLIHPEESVEEFSDENSDYLVEDTQEILDVSTQSLSEPQDNTYLSDKNSNYRVYQDIIKYAESFEEPFAVFVVAPVEGGFAATSRPVEGGIGLPGGKVDPGEDGLQALLRESSEEGWEIYGVEGDPFHKSSVDGRIVWWYRASGATPMESFKEQDRLHTTVVSYEDISTSGYGNDEAMRNY